MMDQWKRTDLYGARGAQNWPMNNLLLTSRRGRSTSMASHAQGLLAGIYSSKKTKQRCPILTKQNRLGKKLFFKNYVRLGLVLVFGFLVFFCRNWSIPVDCISLSSPFFFK